MLKKSIIGLLLLAIAMPAFAGDDVDKKVFVGDWPILGFKYLPVCSNVKVVMKIGYYVKIKDCKKLKIKLEQVSATQYKGCKEFSIMSNFDLELGARITPTANGDKLQPDKSKWSAWITGSNMLAPSTSYQKQTVCAQVKEAKLLEFTPKDEELHVANVDILVRPTALP